MDAVQVKKAVILFVRTCYRSVCKHPFFVGMVIFLILLYRSFPFMFSFLVTASPVLVSTAVLLGTLLSFGNPIVPEIEKEETNHEIASLQIGVPLDDTVIEGDASCGVEKYTGSRSDVDKSIEETSLTANDFSDASKNDVWADSAPLIEENSREFQFEKWETHGESESCDVVFENKNEVREGESELLLNLFNLIQHLDEKSVDDLENAKSPEGYVIAETADRTSPLGSLMKHEDEEQEEDDDVSDSVSDGAESSSPDASMADIIPLLDELHPLLDEDAPRPAYMSLEESDATSENSSESSSDEDTENHDLDVEVAHDEVNEEGYVDNNDEDKSAIRWTEDDQKNLMDLGTSELERNKRLESLIARRRLRKSMKIIAEKNLIDFDAADRPFSMAHISTARRNPFDLPYDDDMGLPPMPGSAPSILLQRRNPFDIPYDSSEEKPDLLGDDFQQDLMILQSKEPVFRRNETFNVGPSLFGTSTHESKFKPYFIPERMTSEGTNYASFHRQPSDLSDSKASSVPETESITSDEDLEDKKPIAEDLINEPEMISIAEPELSSIPEHPFEHVGHGSESSEDADSLDLGQGERDDVVDELEVNLVDVEYYQSSFPATTAAATSIEPNTSNFHLNAQALESKSRSSSPISEVDEEIFAEKEEEEEIFAQNEDALLSIQEPLKGNSNEDYAISHQLSVEESDIKITSQSVDDTQHKEPVYDSTPRSLEKNFSSSSVDSDFHVEKAGTSSPPILIPRLISFTLKDSEVNNQGIINPTHVFEADEEFVAAHHHPPSEERMSQSEKGLSLSDQSVNKQSPRNPEKLQESINDLIDMDFQELDNIYQNIDFLKTFELPEVEEIEAPGADLDANILDRIANDEIIQVLEHHTFPFEANNTDNMENNVEDLDDIEEIDEGLLHELDTVGDFSVKDLRSHLNESGGETFYLLRNFGNSSEDLKDNDDLSRVTLDDEELRASRVEKELSNSEGEMEEDSPFQISKTKFGEHFDSSTRDIVRVEAVDPFDSEKLNDKSLPEETATELADLNIVQNPNAKELNSGIPIVEVQEIHDNEFSYEETEHMPEEMNVGFGESEILHQDPLHVKTEVVMPVFEAHTLDDIRSALSEVDANKSEKQYAADSVRAKLSPDETVDGYSQHEMLHEGSVLPESKTDLTLLESNSVNDGQSALELQQDPVHAETEVVIPISEAGSFGDIESAFSQVDGSDSEKQRALDLVSAKMSPDKTVAGYSQHEILHEGSIPPESKSDLTVLESKIVQDGQSAFAQQHGESVERLISCGSNGYDLDSAEFQDPVETLSSVHVDEARSSEDINAASVQVSRANIEKLPIGNSELEPVDLNCK